MSEEIFLILNLHFKLNWNRFNNDQKKIILNENEKYYKKNNSSNKIHCDSSNYNDINNVKKLNIK